jgi:hypothetical protein
MHHVYLPCHHLHRSRYTCPCVPRRLGKGDRVIAATIAVPAERIFLPSAPASFLRMRPPPPSLPRVWAGCGDASKSVEGLERARACNTLSTSKACDRCPSMAARERKPLPLKKRFLGALPCSCLHCVSVPRRQNGELVQPSNNRVSVGAFGRSPISPRKIERLDQGQEPEVCGDGAGDERNSEARFRNSALAPTVAATS